MARGRMMAVLAVLAAVGPKVNAETVIEDVGGIRYQVTRSIVPQSVPVTETREQQVTTYRQQVTTEMTQHQQVYSVPVTQYQLVSQLHGRWNPFMQPYWTHHYAPVTTYQTQVATVNVPVNRVAWAPETRVVQTPVTTYRTANATVEQRVPIGAAPTAMASRPLSSSQPSATLAARPSEPASSTPIASQRMDDDPPKQGWQSPSRYQ